MKRRRRSGGPQGERGTRPQGAARGAHGAASAGATRWTRWVAYAFIAMFTIYWASQAFTIHRIGNYAVETDFYWKYGPAARDLAHGAIDIANYDSKGWGYPAVVTAVSAFGFETFRAGQIVALLSAALALFLLYRLHRSLFGPGVALAGMLILAGNKIFLANTYEVGTDMFFLAVTLASIALLLRSHAPGWRAILASGLLGGWAFSTRYNGLVLWPGALALFLLFRVPTGPPGARWRRAALYTAGFAVGALPWLWINAAHTGNPLTNSNYVNVGYAVYGEGNWEKFFYGSRNIHSFADVVKLDPGRFVTAMVKNVGDHLRRDLFELMSPIWGILAVLGAILLALERPGRRISGYLAFGLLTFLSLVPVFYGARFSLPLLPFYVALATWPFASPRVAQPFAGMERAFPVRAFAFLVLWIPVGASAYGWTKDVSNPENVQSGPHDLDPAVSFLREQPPGAALMARKPHAAFLANMRFVPMPDASSPDSLRAEALKGNARYVLISGIEYGTRLAARTLASQPDPPPGWKRVFESQGALVFEVQR
ncbi:MAG: glycosyltransferase family 39 protein [Bacteroidota bacterium]